jgi:hypothetical protein
MKEPPGLKPWPIRVPTTLTVLQCGSGCVDGDDLPCTCQDEKDGQDGGNGKDDGHQGDHG